MFSKQDYIRYFEQIACLERQRIYRIVDILADLEDVRIAGKLKGLVEDATKSHAQILDVFQSEFFSGGAGDKRLLNRRSALGKVRLIFKSRGGLQEIAAHCINFTHQGLCLESGHKVSVGAYYEVQILLYGQPEPMSCAGRIAWVKEIFPGFFMAGMHFNS